MYRVCTRGFRPQGKTSTICLISFEIIDRALHRRADFIWQHSVRPDVGALKRPRGLQRLLVLGHADGNRSPPGLVLLNLA